VLLTLLRKELRTLFRDKQVLVYSLLLPIFLYPLLLFSITQIKHYTEGLKEQAPMRVAIHGMEDAWRLQSRISRIPGIQVEAVGLSQPLRVKKGSLELSLSLSDKGLELEYDSRRQASVAARERILPILSEWQGEQEIQLGKELGLSETELVGPAIVTRDLSTGELTGERILALLLPLILLVMTTFGATYPALELTAGECEQSTAETTALLPVSLRQVALSKTLAAGLTAYASLIINLCAVTLCASPILASMGAGQTNVPAALWHALPWILLFGLLISMVFSSLFLMAGSYARNFREAQAYATPIQLLALAPGMSLLLTVDEPPLGTALIPIYNAGQSFRMILLGQLPSDYLILTLMSLCTFALLCFRMTQRRLGSTEFALGFRDLDQESPGGSGKQGNQGKRICS
jgi:sodium transport system permease protein